MGWPSELLKSAEMMLESRIIIRVKSIAKEMNDAKMEVARVMRSKDAGTGISGLNLDKVSKSAENLSF